MNHRALARLNADAALDRIRALVRIWDEAVQLPLIGKVGLDALLGLIPGFGDVAGAVVALYPLIEAARLGAGPVVIARMGLNVVVDFTLGAIPLLGDLFDIGWKANRRNLDLLEHWLRSPAAVARSSLIVVGGVVALTLGALVGLGWLIVALFRALLG